MKRLIRLELQIFHIKNCENSKPYTKFIHLKSDVLRIDHENLPSSLSGIISHSNECQIDFGNRFSLKIMGVKKS